MVRAARLPAGAHHPVDRGYGDVLHRLPRHGGARLRQHPVRVPVPPGLREARLAARPLPAGHRAAPPHRDDRHPGRARHLRRARDGSAAGAWSWSTSTGRRSARPTRSSASTSASTSSSCRSGARSWRSRRPSCSSPASPALAASYLYGAMRFGGREVRISRAARVQLAMTAAVYIALQAVSLWLDQYAALTKSNSLITGAQYTEVERHDPRPRDHGGHRGDRRAPVHRHGGHRALAHLRSSAPGCCSSSAIVIGGIYPWIVQRCRSHPSRALVRVGVHPAQHRRDA